jgi:hypothetical protein
MAEPESIQVPFQDLYASRLRHQTAALVEQVDTGLYALKRYAYYLQKMCQMRKPVVAEMIKATEHEAEKKTRVEKDRMQNHVVAYRRVQDVYFQMLTDELKFVTAVNETVAEPLLQWHKNAEKRRDTLIKREQQLVKDYKDMQARLVANRSACHKQWQLLQQAHKDLLKAQELLRSGKKGADKDYAAAEKKAEKERAKTEQLFQQLEQSVVHGNASQDTYWNKELPALIQDWERLEVERLQMMGSHMAVFARLQRQLVAPLDQCVTSVEADVAALDGKSEMRDFAMASTRQFGAPVAPTSFTDQLPCAASTLHADNPSLLPLLGLELSAAIALRERELAGGAHSGSMSYTAQQLSMTATEDTTADEINQMRLAVLAAGTPNPSVYATNAVPSAPPPVRPPPPSFRAPPTPGAGSVPAVAPPISPIPGTAPPPPRFGSQAGTHAPVPPAFAGSPPAFVAAPPPPPPPMAVPMPPPVPVAASAPPSAPAPPMPPSAPVPPPVPVPVTDSAPPATSGIPGEGSHGAVFYARGVYDFATNDPEDVGFEAGAILAVLDDSGASGGEGWLKGAIVLPDGSFGRAGTFPSNYVERC